MQSATLASPVAGLSFLPELPRPMLVVVPTCLRVLVAEDQPLLRRLMVRTIERLGHEVVAAEDGVQAWELFAAQGADVVITDWLMPGMDGLDLCRRLRAECADSVPYVILASVLDDPRDVENGLGAGADEYLIKPIATLALEARLIAVERMLRHHTRAKTHVATDGQLDAARRATEADHEQHLPETMAEVARRLTFDVEKLYRWNALDQALSRAHDAPRDGR